MRMNRKGLAAACSLVLITTWSASAADSGAYFERIATMPVYQTLAEGVDRNTETAAEIITASEDGNTLLFTDSPGEALVLVDALDPVSPKAAGRITLPGEPTSVAVAKGFALTGVNTSASYTQPSGHLAVIDIAKQAIVASCDVKGQPDSVAVSPDRRFVAIAIENERDEDLNDGVIPQLPAGHLAIFNLDQTGKPSNCDAATLVDMRGLAEVAPSDPEPEFVAINDDNIAVVTLQENNHIVLVDLATAKVIKHFSAGYASASNIPVKKARSSDASGSIKDVAREPDAVAWIDNTRFVTADEGDYQGGSRSFTIFNVEGEVLFSSAAQMEHLAMRHGHYPAKRAHKKGSEPEGVTVGKFGEETYIFVNSERANFVAVYKDTGGEPEFVQFLPTHVKPEGLLALPQRGLFVVANEEDSAEDKVRAAVGIYQFSAKQADYPSLVSAIDKQTQAPIGWGALSGLAADPNHAERLFAVSDSFYDDAAIFSIDLSKQPAEISSKVVLSGGKQAKYDLEGIVIRQQGGFWLVSEGHPKKGLQHLLLQVSESGQVEQEIELPADFVAQAKRFSLEGVAEFGERVIVAFQREWKDDPKGYSKLGIFEPKSNNWNFVHYPLDKPVKGWVGLSEITHLGEQRFALLERDNQSGPDAAIKQVTVIDLAEVQPVMVEGEKLMVVSKQVKIDLLPLMQASKGWTPDKVEGLAVTKDGQLWAVTDNDGVDDASGETQLLNLGSVELLK